MHPIKICNLLLILSKCLKSITQLVQGYTMAVRSCVLYVAENNRLKGSL